MADTNIVTYAQASQRRRGERWSVDMYEFDVSTYRAENDGLVPWKGIAEKRPVNGRADQSAEGRDKEPESDPHAAMDASANRKEKYGLCGSV